MSTEKLEESTEIEWYRNKTKATFKSHLFDPETVEEAGGQDGDPSNTPVKTVCKIATSYGPFLAVPDISEVPEEKICGRCLNKLGGYEALVGTETEDTEAEEEEEAEAAADPARENAAEETEAETVVTMENGPMDEVSLDDRVTLTVALDSGPVVEWTGIVTKEFGDWLEFDRQDLYTIYTAFAPSVTGLRDAPDDIETDYADVCIQSPDSSEIEHAGTLIDWEISLKITDQDTEADQEDSEAGPVNTHEAIEEAGVTVESETETDEYVVVSEDTDVVVSEDTDVAVSEDTEEEAEAEEADQDSEAEDTEDQDTEDTEETETYACDECDFETDTKRGLSAHVSQTHDVERGTFECDECDFETDTKRGLSAHQAQVHD